MLQQRVDRLEALTQRVEAISAIKRLQHAYGHYAELGLWHDFADLFADTGIGHYAQGALDREGVRALFLKEVGGGRLGLADGRIYPHISMQPVVTLAEDGQSGKGRWHIMAMLGGYEKSASWAGGVYENQYVRENGVWKFKTMRVYPRFIVDAEKGWAKDAQHAPGPSREFPPDRPPTETYEIYPRFHIAPFHFDHPVTGRPPQYPGERKRPLQRRPSRPPSGGRPRFP